MNKKIIIAFVGEAGAGKDTCAQLVTKKLKEAYNLNAHFIVSCTTRPMRAGEQDGVNYHYLTIDEFGTKVLNGDMLEATCFNDWFYGTSFEDLVDGINIGVFNPAGIEAIKDNPNIILKGYYIYCSPKERLIRQLQREENPNIEEIIRRYKTDLEDFEDIQDLCLIKVTNNTKQEQQDLVDRICSDILYLVKTE